MATGALTLGVGAGLAAGAGIAQADTGTDHAGAAAYRPKAAAAAAPAQHHARDRRTTLTRSTATMRSANAVASAWSVPALPSLPSPGVVVQHMVNVMTAIVSNSPIRGLLDTITPVSSTSGVSAIRLPGSPVGTAMSADGSHIFVTTAPFTAGIPFVAFPGAYSVTEIDTRTNTIVGIPVAVEGGATGGVVLSADGTRAALMSSTGTYGSSTRVTVIDTANSAVINAVDLSGSVGLTVFAPDGDHVFCETLDSPSSSVAVAVIDGRTGTPTGPPAQISGFPIGYLAFSGTRGYLTTIASTAGVSTTTVTVIETADNSIAGSVIIGGVADGGVVISPDGTKAAQVTSDTSFGGSKITMFDTATLAAIGSPILLGGYRNPYVPAMFSDGGNRLSAITGTPFGSQLLVFDTATDAPVSTPIALAAGSLFLTGATVFGPNADLLYIPDVSVDENGKTHTTAIVVDTVSGTVVGSPLVFDGDTAGLTGFAISPDRTRVFQTLTRDADSSIAIIGADGGLVAPTVQLSGYTSRPVQFSLDGSRAYQTTNGISAMTTAIDAATGTVIGNPVAVRSDGGDDVWVAASGNPVYRTTRITLFEFIIPLPSPWGFGIVWSLASTHINAIDAAAF